MARRPPLSGFCNQSNPPDSHARCHLPDCTCWCHWKADPVPEAPEPTHRERPGAAPVPATVAEGHEAVRDTRAATGLRVYPDVIQGTDEWHDQRRGMVTASVVGQLVTPSTMKVAANETSRSITALLVAERITGYTDPTFISDDMLRGIEDEPRAVAKYGEHHAPVKTVGFMVRDDWGFEIGYSPDGLVGDDGLVEVKSRRQKHHLRTILADEVPAEFVAQIQCGLLVSGRAWCDFISYCGGMPLYVRRVLPDPAWHDAIVAAVRAFEETAEQMASTYLTAVEGWPTTERTYIEEMI